MHLYTSPICKYYRNKRLYVVFSAQFVKHGITAHPISGEPCTDFQSVRKSLPQPPGSAGESQ